MENSLLENIISKSKHFLRKIIKNKIVFLVLVTILLLGIYYIAKNAIRNYNFNDTEISTNSEIEELGEEEFIQEDEQSVSEEEEEIKEQDVVTEKAENKIFVYVTGEVNNPGVITLNEGCRIVDAINAAGGTTANANIDKINLVYVLEDGMKINIPNKNELINNPDFEYITKNSGEGGSDSEISENNKTENSSTKKKSLVNINSATQTELETLPGIGPSLALRIINYRKENGKFSSIEEIKNVSGIGEKKYEDLKEYITV